MTIDDIKDMIKLNQNKNYYDDRKEEYKAFYKVDESFIVDLDNRFGIESEEYKMKFLYPTFFNIMTTKELIFNSYNEASKYYSLRQLLGRPDKFNEQRKLFNYMSTILMKNSVVLDYGCCVGDFSILFAKMGYKVISMDLDIPTFEFAIKRYSDRKLDIDIYKIKSDFKIPNINNKLDFVFCRDVLEHTTNPFYVLKFFYNNLLKNGYLYISTMNPGETIYSGSEHLKESIDLVLTNEYKQFFDKHFERMNLHGLYRRK